jgi:hypothetical protein
MDSRGINRDALREGHSVRLIAHDALSFGAARFASEILARKQVDAHPSFPSCGRWRELNLFDEAGIADGNPPRVSSRRRTIGSASGRQNFPQLEFSEICCSYSFRCVLARQPEAGAGTPDEDFIHRLTEAAALARLDRKWAASAWRQTEKQPAAAPETRAVRPDSFNWVKYILNGHRACSAAPGFCYE